jgi:striatin 1/3/4
LEGERRSFENVKLDLMRRIKMLEYALRMERFELGGNSLMKFAKFTPRSKQLSQSSVSVKAPSVTHSDKQATSSNKEDSQSAKEGSVSSSPRSDGRLSSGVYRHNVLNSILRYSSPR